MWSRRTKAGVRVNSLTRSEKWLRLKDAVSDPEWRRYGTLLFVGKMLGIAILMVGITMGPQFISQIPSLLCGTAQAQTTDAVPTAAPAATATDAAATPAADAAATPPRRIRMTPLKLATSSTRSTRCGCCSPRSSSSACRWASPCSKPASAARAKRSTCSWSASSTPACAASCSTRGASPSCLATATALSAGATGNAGTITTGSSCKMRRRPTKAPASRSWRTGCSSSRSPIVLRRSAPAP